MFILQTFKLSTVQMKLIGESATRSEAHRARGKRNQNKQPVRSANSLLIQMLTPDPMAGPRL